VRLKGGREWGSDSIQSVNLRKKTDLGRNRSNQVETLQIPEKKEKERKRNGVKGTEREREREVSIGGGKKGGRERELTS